MGRRGNPNWIRAAEERRARAKVAAEEVKANDARVMTLGTAIGAAAGGVAIAMGAQHFGVDRKRVAIAAAGGGLALAVASSGWIRAIAGGVAAAGIAIAIAEWLKAPKVERPKAEPQKAAPQATDRLSKDEAGDVPPLIAVAADNRLRPPPVARADSASVMARFRDVASRLTLAERQRLAEALGSATDDEARALQALLARTTATEAAESLRRLLASGNGLKRLFAGNAVSAAGVA